MPSLFIIFLNHRTEKKKTKTNKTKTNTRKILSKIIKLW